jgi:hypothetical protein
LLAQIPPQAGRVWPRICFNPHVSGRRTLDRFPRGGGCRRCVPGCNCLGLAGSTPAICVGRSRSCWRAILGLPRPRTAICCCSAGLLLASCPQRFSRLAGAARGAGGGLTQTEVLFGDEQGAAVRCCAGYAAASDRWYAADLVVTLLWEALRPLHQELHVYIAYLDPQSQPFQESQFYPPPVLPVVSYHAAGTGPGREDADLARRVEDAQFGLSGVFAGEEGWAGGRATGCRAR